jgi:hypothetical protein
VNYILLNYLRQTLNFNNQSTAETRLHSYQGLQRAKEEMLNILINGGKKYNKMKRKHAKKNRKLRKKKKKRKEKGTKKIQNQG